MMHNQTNKNTKRRIHKLSSVLTTWVLLVTMLLQSLSLGAAALAEDLSSIFRPSAPQNGAQSGIASFDTDATIAALKKDLLKSINQDLLMKVEDYQLTGEVGAVLTFSEDSLINTYSSSKESEVMTYEDFRETIAARETLSALARNHEKVVGILEEKKLVSEVKFHYYHLLDGVYVTTTYEQLEALCAVEGIERVTVSNTYLPAVAVENPVNVYDTGIFNSSDVDYTGKGTIVAVLDTGCDYTHSAFTTHDVVSPLYDRDDIESMLKSTMAYGYDNALEAREVYYGNITSNKIAFGYDYADKDSDIMPFANDHGTHVAGIIGGMDDTITGVAIDAQLAIMKVFSDYEVGADDGDILAALEDSIILGVDAINMSLGTSCGFTREVDDEYKNTLYDNIEKAGISLIVAASNDYSSGFGSEQGNTNKTSNPDSATVGSPSTYKAALAVASIEGNKAKYILANGSREVFFDEAVNQAAKEYDFFAMLGVTKDNKREMEYVTIPGFGLAINYAGIDVTGKVALVKRGDISFEEKVQFAYEAGAAAIIIYNNVFGDIAMTVGKDAKIPVASIGKDDGDALALQASGTLVFDAANEAGPFMSDFSSWGPSPDLSLKPEITAHGGNILSAIPGGGYDKLSGTSMAAPNMCGITVLIRQYVKEKYPNLTPAEVRDLVNQLCMSTATIALDRKGNPYSPRKQGAGIADIAKATQTPAFLFVEGMGKTKLELGDDPSRKGVYTMSIQLKNLSDASVAYRVGSVAMTESVSTSDPEYVAEMGYLLSNTAEYSVVGATFSDGIVEVAPGTVATVTVTLTLSAADKAYINSSFENGMYVEGFLTFDNVEADGVDLNAPFLAFYGDWSEAPIFDLDYYEVETEAHNNAIDDDDKIKADYYATTPTGSYYYDYILPLGSYVYQMDESEYTAIPATEEKAAISYYADTISGIYGVFAGLLRGAKEMNITIRKATTGEVVWSETQYNCYKSHYNGAPYPHVSLLQIPMADYKTGEVFGYNNERFEVTMTAQLDWDGNRNSNDTYSFSFYIDYEAPTITDATFRTEYDKSLKKNRYYVDLMVYDNHYAMSVRPIIVYNYAEADGTIGKTYSSMTEYPIPVYQEERGTASKVSVEITDYIPLIQQSSMPEGITFYVDDYAMNSNVCYVPFPETESQDLEFNSPTLDLDINETFDLTEYLSRADAEVIENDYLKTLTWTTSDASVVAIKDGKIEAKKSGSATISVTGDSWVYTETVGGQKVEHQLYKTIVINVSENVMENPNSSDRVPIEALEFSSYLTLFAFNSDIDYSEIGATDSLNFFDGNYSISCYPSEQVRLNYRLDPWNLDPERYTLTWSSSNPKVATVDENGVVTAESEGRARITLQITVDGKTSLLAARCTVVVKSEFVIENRSLIAYKGKGGDVVIPDDEGIMNIGAFAFCHYDLDNEKEVEKDEDGNYDMDDKKAPLGNKTVTSVVIPEGVETIEKYAFYNCEVLGNVTIPSTCKTISEYAFYDCVLLENVNLDNVQSISNYAFYGCESLTGKALGGINLSHVSAIGEYAFAKTRIASADLSNLSRSGKGAFSDCSKLESVILGKRTRVAANMFEKTAVESVVIYSDTIGDQAFTGCESLQSVEVQGNLTYLGAEAFSGCTELERITFAGDCEEIAMFAFFGCESLESLTLPGCEVVIGDCAFASSGLKELILAPETVITWIGAAAFESVKGMQIDTTASERYVLKDGVLYTSDETCIVLALPDARLGDFVVPAGVKEIASGAFSSNAYLTSVSFASGSALEQIGYGAFAGCPKLKTVTLPAHSVSIGEMAFCESIALKSINLQNVTYIGDFAFESTAIVEAEITADDAVIGMGAFYGNTALKKVTLGDRAKIGAYAFCETSITTLLIEGTGVTVDEGAFYACTKLTEVSFDKMAGTIGAYAFYYCTGITEVHMPYVTEIGEGSFAECTSLRSFRADALEVIGANAFAPLSETSQSGATFRSVYLPSLRVVGDYAFYGCIYLTSIDLSEATEIGEGAFAFCQSMTSVTLSEEMKHLKQLTFYGCVALKNLDLSHVEVFGQGCVYGVQMPAELRLDSAKYIESMAFIEMDDTGAHYLETVYAPNLIHVADQAFAGCSNLSAFYAPQLQFIGYGAFAYTVIEEFEISSALDQVEFSIFEGNDHFTGFFATVDGEKVYDFEENRVMISDGVLYTVTDKGYILTVYPNAKEDTELTVVDGTVRIEYTAAVGNKFLETVILPESMKSIGNYAFYGCENLTTVVFKSFYAPELEGTVTGDEIKITPDNVEEYPGFDILYRYDYYFRQSDIVAMPYYYSNFVAPIASKDAANLTFIIPVESEGYDRLVYRAYFQSSEENSGVATGRYALAFIDAVNRLPEVVDRFDKALVDAAINAYNALVKHTDELDRVDDALIERFFAARSEYNVSATENKINHLFDMACNEYSYEKVKEARAAFLALTAEEQALVKNASVLDEKIEDLAAVMGKTLDFSLSFRDYFPEGVTPDTPDEPAKIPTRAEKILAFAIPSAVAFFSILGIAIMIKKKREL